MSSELQMAGLTAFLAGLDDAIAEAVALTAVDVGDLARQLAPEDTGDLKASGEVVDGDRPGVTLVRFGAGLPDIRALAQEYGTVYSDAQPYLTPAADAIDPGFRARALLAELARRSRV